jgi:hypothetical protein
MPIRVSRQVINVTQRQGLALGGAVLVALSLPVGLVLPSIPLALPMAAIGAVLVGLNAVWARRGLDDMFRRYPQVEKKVPDWLILMASGRQKRGAAE